MKMGELVIAPPTITINYEPGKNWLSPICWILNDLIVERRLPVLLVGEGNFSFTLALAAVRGSWDGITATCFNRLSFEDPIAIPFEDPYKDLTYANYWMSLQLLSVGHCITNSMILDGETPVGLRSILTSIPNIRNIGIPPQPSIKGGVNCTSIPDQLVARIVWFQCPWTPDRNELGELLQTFLKNSRSEYVLIGIANQYPYTLSYKLGSLFETDLTRHPNAQIECFDYIYLGADNVFIETILKHGYKHEGCHPDRDIHTVIIKDHITLIFQRKKCF